VKNKENNFVSAVLYVHNKQNAVGIFIDQLSCILSDNFLKYEITYAFRFGCQC